MEIKKEDLKMFRIVDTHFVAFDPSILDDMPEVIPEKVIEMVEKEIEVVEPTEEELKLIGAAKEQVKLAAELEAKRLDKLEAIAKAKEIEELKAKLASLEE